MRASVIVTRPRPYRLAAEYYFVVPGRSVKGLCMSTSTPPPYFPQGSLMPPDPGRARKFKLTVIGCAVLLVLGLAALVAGVVYLIRALV